MSEEERDTQLVRHYMLTDRHASLSSIGLSLLGTSFLLTTVTLYSYIYTNYINMLPTSAVYNLFVNLLPATAYSAIAVTVAGLALLRAGISRTSIRQKKVVNWSIYLYAVVVIMWLVYCIHLGEIAVNVSIGSRRSSTIFLAIAIQTLNFGVFLLLPSLILLQFLPGRKSYLILLPVLTAISSFYLVMTSFVKSINTVRIPLYQVPERSHPLVSIIISFFNPSFGVPGFSSLISVYYGFASVSDFEIAIASNFLFAIAYIASAFSRVSRSAIPVMIANDAEN